MQSNVMKQFPNKQPSARVNYENFPNAVLAEIRLAQLVVLISTSRPMSRSWPGLGRQSVMSIDRIIVTDARVL